MTRRWLTCEELVELVTDYVEDRMPVDERMRFEEHLAACGPCRTYLKQMRETIQLTGGLSQETLDPKTRDTLLDAFRTWKS
ncbi:MAG: anti-sigma factor family protein [Gaiellaceae bacterium]